MRQEKKAEVSSERSNSFERMRNGCCRECMKAFSSNGKACICQVPSSVRRRKLPDTGCIFCGCFGCNPEDTQKLEEEKRGSPERIETSKYPRKTSSQIQKRRRGSVSDDEDMDSRSRTESEPEGSNSPGDRQEEPNLDNLNNSFIGNFLRNTFNIYPPLMGFGIPQRTYSYIYGKPPPR
jgi:hypothetical protein